MESSIGMVYLQNLIYSQNCWNNLLKCMSNQKNDKQAATYESWANLVKLSIYILQQLY